jgi:hypothetical protein
MRAFALLINYVGTLTSSTHVLSGCWAPWRTSAAEFRAVGNLESRSAAEESLTFAIADAEKQRGGSGMGRDDRTDPFEGVRVVAAAVEVER